MNERIDLLNKQLRLRPASEEDIQLAFKWQLDQNVRVHSRNKHPPTWNKHQRWFLSALNNNAIELWILEYQQQSIGQLRLDLHSDNEVSILIDPEYMGKGIGFVALSILCEKHLDKSLCAYIEPGNTASIKIFERCQFRKQGGNWYKRKAKA